MVLSSVFCDLISHSIYVIFLCLLVVLLVLLVSPHLHIWMCNWTEWHFGTPLKFIAEAKTQRFTSIISCGSTEANVVKRLAANWPSLTPWNKDFPVFRWRKATFQNVFQNSLPGRGSGSQRQISVNPFPIPTLSWAQVLGGLLEPLPAGRLTPWSRS